MMNMIIWTILLKILIIIILLFLTMFFVASETSLTVLRRSQINRLIKENGISQLKAWLDDPNRLLTTTLVGTGVSVIGVSVIGTTIALDISRIYGLSAILATAISTVIMVIIVLIFAEIVPKAFAMRNAQKVSCKIIGPLRIVDFILTPAVKIFTFMSNVVIKIFRGKSLKEQPLFAVEEIKGLIELGVKEGVIAKAEKKMLSQIMEFGDTVVREVMVPRVDMKSLDIEETGKEAINEIVEMRHSRIPVYEKNMDNIIGILYIKDLLPVLARSREIDIRKILRKPYFVPEIKQIGELLKEFRQGREHLAIVVDEYGVSAGLITIEDIVEEITGEIFDEYDIQETRIVKINEKSWEISAIEDLDKINDELNIDLPEDTYDSLGGLIVGELRRFPETGEEITYRQYKFKILNAAPNRVLKVRIELP